MHVPVFAMRNVATRAWCLRQVPIKQSDVPKLRPARAVTLRPVTCAVSERKFEGPQGVMPDSAPAAGNSRTGCSRSPQTLDAESGVEHALPLWGIVVSRRGRGYWGRNAFAQAGPWPAHVRAGQSYLADRPARHRLRAGPPQEQKCSDEHTAWPAQGLHGAGNRCSPIIPCHSSARRLKSL